MTTLVCLLVQVLFSKSAEEKIQQLAKDAGSQRAQAAHLLHNTVNVINQVGQHRLCSEEEYLSGLECD